MAKRLAWGVIALVALGGAAERAAAAPIVYTFQGTASGTVGGKAFTDAAFSISVSADTASVALVPGFSNIYSVDASATELSLAGFGTGSFSVGTRVFDNQGIPAAGFSRAGPFGLDLLDMHNAAFKTYGLVSSLGPVSDPTPSAVNQFNNISTTLGSLTFSSARDVTFTATLQTQALPEPPTLVLFGLGVAGLLGCARLRRWPARSLRPSAAA